MQLVDQTHNADSILSIAKARYAELQARLEQIPAIRAELTKLAAIIQAAEDT